MQIAWRVTTAPRVRYQPRPGRTRALSGTSAGLGTGIPNPAHPEHSKTHRGGGIVKSVPRGIIVMLLSDRSCGMDHTSARLGIIARMVPLMQRSLHVPMESLTI